MFLTKNDILLTKNDMFLTENNEIHAKNDLWFVVGNKKVVKKQK
jgi:hypothetical protein